MIVATAGHVDHGKTSLVKTLTGIDTDRLPEEKRRGLTIDLGFAYLALDNGTRIGFVDVPGHERFIRNMAAGVGAVDYALLVIAADDGIMPQTHEHLTILTSLGVTSGAIIVTKTDLVDKERLNQLLAELEASAFPSFLSGAPVFCVSSLSGEGIEALTGHLASLAASYQRRPREGRFRMAVDRVFSLKGTGTIVTGSISCGTVQNGERCVISPQGLEVRIRSLRVNGLEATEAAAGHRCALNINVSADMVRRGSWIVAPEVHHPVERADCRIRLTPGSEKPIRSGARAHIHLGTADIVASIHILEGRSLPPGEDRLAQLVFEQPVSCLAGDRFVLRDLSATSTFAGGLVIDPGAPARGRARPERLEILELLAKPPDADAFRALLQANPEGADLARYAWMHNLGDTERERIAASVPTIDLTLPSATVALDPQHWQDLVLNVTESLKKWHDTRPESPGATLAELRACLVPRPSLQFFASAIARMLAEKRLERSGAWLHLLGHKARISDTDQARLAELRALYRSFGTRAPMVSEASDALHISEEDLHDFLARMARRGHVTQVSSTRYFLAEQLASLAGLAERLASDHPDAGFTAQMFRDHSDLGRNLTIEILEFFDLAGLTIRKDNHRTLRRPADELFTAETD